MRDLGTIVGVLVLTINNRRHHLLFRCRIASKLVRNQLIGDSPLAFQELTEEALGSTLVLTALHENIQDVTVLVDGAPKILAFALNRHGNLIEEPTVTERSAPLSKASRVVEAKPGTPLPD